MNIKKIKSKKALKFLSLLISAIVIATVSAAGYNYMYITGRGGISTGTGLKWELGPDGTTIGATIDGSTVSDVNMTVNDGNPRNYTNTLHIVNQDGSPHTFSLEVTKSPSSAGNKANFTEFKLVLFDSDNVTEYAVLDLKTQGSTASGLTIGSSVTLRVLFELVPIPVPTDGAKVDFEVELTYE